jgi:hypothetical protein
MHSITMFDSTKESLQDLLRGIRDGKTQLPDFQRGWVWDDEHIRSLLASVSMSYPIGAVMMLQTGNPDVRFKPRPVEGVPLVQPPEPERLILDGQQRLTSLFQALFMGQPVATKDARDKSIRRWYYIDIRKAFDPDADREEAVVGVPEDRVFRNFRGEVIDGRDYSTPEKECAAELLPLQLVFDQAGLMNWTMKYLQADASQTQARMARWNALVQEVVQRFQQYQVPLILLRKETPKEAVCQVFEKVNTGGVSLNVFELLTATFAADEYHLRDDWAAREKRLRQRKVLGLVESTEFLQAITLLTTRDRRLQGLAQGAPPENAPGVTCKRKDILRLTLGEYRRWADPLTDAFARAAKFLNGLRIYDARDLPYHAQLAPLAATLAALGNRADDDGVRGKIGRWYWCGVFGELYGGAIESRFAKDLPEVLGWLDGGPEPATIADANFAPTRLVTLRTRNSAAYKVLHALLMRDGCLDFRTGYPYDVQTYFDERTDIHHIFPQAWWREKKLDAKRCDSVVNKTPISAKTNRTIGGNAPSVYLARLQKSAEIEPDRMDEILRSHQIDPVALRADDFEGFSLARSQALGKRVSSSRSSRSRASCFQSRPSGRFARTPGSAAVTAGGGNRPARGESQPFRSRSGVGIGQQQRSIPDPSHLLSAERLRQS